MDLGVVLIWLIIHFPMILWQVIFRLLYCCVVSSGIILFSKFQEHQFKFSITVSFVGIFQTFFNFLFKGQVSRDFTYIDDIVEGVIAALERGMFQKKVIVFRLLYFVS